MKLMILKIRGVKSGRSWGKAKKEGRETQRRFSVEDCGRQVKKKRREERMPGAERVVIRPSTGSQRLSAPTNEPVVAAECWARQEQAPALAGAEGDHDPELLRLIEEIALGLPSVVIG